VAPELMRGHAIRPPADASDNGVWRLQAAVNVGHMGTNVVSTSPDIMGGTPVFPGTRVPVQTLLDYIEAGDTIDEFLRGFPTVTREHVVAFLERGPV
jgi:uncharacterized protein (DUF433 family)